MLTNDEKVALKMIEEVLIQIRQLARKRDNPARDAESACMAIYALADAAHNLPETMLRDYRDESNAKDALAYNFKRIEEAGKLIFGDRSTLHASTFKID